MAILEDRGIFWWNNVVVPEKQFAPDESVGGKLTIEDTGSIRLELDTVMPGTRPFDALRNSSQPSKINIQGLLANSGHALLLNVIGNGGTMKTSNMSQENYLALQCLVGPDAFKPDRKEPISFRSMSVELAGFEDWLWLRGIKVDRRKTKATAKYTKQNDKHYKVPFGNMAIEYDLSGPYFGESTRRTLNLVESARVKITPKKKVSLEDCQTFYQLVEELLILLTSSDHNTDWPNLLPSGSKQQAKLYHAIPVRCESAGSA